MKKCLKFKIWIISYVKRESSRLNLFHGIEILCIMMTTSILYCKLKYHNEAEYKLMIYITEQRRWVTRSINAQHPANNKLMKLNCWPSLADESICSQRLNDDEKKKLEGIISDLFKEFHWKSPTSLVSSELSSWLLPKRKSINSSICDIIAQLEKWRTFESRKRPWVSVDLSH